MEPIYLDYNATTPYAPEVIAAVTASMQANWGNASSSYSIGVQAKKAVEASRRKIARMLNASSPNDIVFTSGGTEANKLAIESAIFHGSLHDDKVAHVITSQVEHCSVINLLDDLKRAGKIELTAVPVNLETAAVEANSIIEAIKPNTKLITVMQANNETGVIMPISAIGEKLIEVNVKRKEKGLPAVLFHTDAAQTIGKIIVDVDDLKVDYLTVVGHKFYGPRIGALYARDIGSAAPILPTFLGGGQERGYRSGTENTCMIEGLGVAAELVTENILLYNRRMAETRNRLAESLTNRTPGVQVNFDDTSHLPNTLSLAVPDATTGAKVLAACSGRVYASLGAACHSGSDENERGSVLTNSGLSKGRAVRTIRLSVGRGTTFQDVEIATDAIASACRL